MGNCCQPYLGKLLSGKISWGTGGVVVIEPMAVMQFNTSQLDYNPVGNATYYSQSIATSIGTGAANRLKYVTNPGLSMSIKALTLIGCTDGTLSSGETTLFEILDEDDTLLHGLDGPTFGQEYEYIEETGLNIPLTATKGIRINWYTPVWSLNPTQICWDLNLYIELT